jgi:hypothetical protein
MNDPSKNLDAAFKDLAHSLIGVAVAAILTYLAQPDALTALLAVVPAKYALPAGLLASALSAAARNWLKHRGE